MTKRGGRTPHHRRAKLVLLTPRGKAAYDAATRKIFLKAWHDDAVFMK
jgi:DNA-binding MarR family transcriptional regulator